MPGTYFELAQDITRAQAERVLAGEQPTVETLLADADRCPSCAGPLIRGDRIAYCTDCGSEVSR